MSTSHLAFPSNMTNPCTNKSISSIRRQRRIRNTKKTLHILTLGAMRACGLTFMVICTNDINHDIRERNVTIRSEI